MDEIIATLIVFGVLFGVLLGISCFTESHTCSETGKALNYKTEWHYWTGCVVEKPDGSRVLLKQMRDWRSH